MQLFYEPTANGSTFTLNKEEAQHCIKVLRKKTGDVITVIDGRGTFFECSIVSDNIKNCQLNVQSLKTETQRDHSIHIAIAPTKNIDRTEWFVEKATEIGVDEISFVLCSNSERRQLNNKRILKKAVSAMKQSLKASLPIFNAMIPYTEFIETFHDGKAYIAYVDFSNPDSLTSLAKSDTNHLILIGPEGDFTQNELELAMTNGFQKVSLGKSRLRTETAGIVACTILNQL